MKELETTIKAQKRELQNAEEKIAQAQRTIREEQTEYLLFFFSFFFSFFWLKTLTTSFFLFFLFRSRASKQRALIDNLERELEAKETHHSTAVAQKQDLEARISQLRRTTQEAEDEAKALRDRLQEDERQLKMLQSQKDNHLRSFGVTIPEVLQEIGRRRGEFHSKVVGPVGKHIRLRDLQWSQAMFNIIGGLLPNFIVQDFHDANILKEIFRKFKWFVVFVVLFFFFF